MRYERFLIPALLVGLSSTLAAHDLFLKLSDYVVAPQSTVRVTALNGTFTTSANSIARSRVADLSLIDPSGRQRVDTTHLATVGTRTVITTRTGPPGTYLLGLSTHPSELALTGAEFTSYLGEEGLSRVVEERRRDGESSQGVRERYAKHVKTLFQVGTTRTDDYSVALGYPAEIIPLQNPYELRPGDTLRVQLLVNGAAATDVEAIAGGRTLRGVRLRPQSLFPNADGRVSLVVRSAGTWYVKFISMTRATEPNLDYVSHWATLTFAVLPAGGRDRSP